MIEIACGLPPHNIAREITSTRFKFYTATRNVQLGRFTTPAKRQTCSDQHLPFTLKQSFRLVLTVYPVAGWDRILIANIKALTLLLAIHSNLACAKPFGVVLLIHLRIAGSTFLHPWTLGRYCKIIILTRLRTARSSLPHLLINRLPIEI